MAIKTGIGVGSAQVFDTSGIVGNFAKMLQKQQQDEAKFQTEIADLIAKVDTKGVRDADKMEIANMYDATKELYRQAAQAKNFQEKALLRSKISKAVNDINEYAYNSANFSKRYADLGKDVLTNSWAYDPKIVDKFRSLANQSLLKMGGAAALDPSEYQKIPNEKSRENVFSDIKRQGEDFATSKFVREGAREREIKTLSDDYVVGNIYKKFLSNPEYKFKAIYDFKQTNPDIEITDEAIVANELAKYKTSFGTTYKGSAVRMPQKSGDTIIIGGDSVQPKTFVTDEVVKKDKNDKPILDKKGRPVMAPGRPSLEFSKFVVVNPEQFSMPQLGKRLNIGAGYYEPFNSSGNVEIVGVGTRTGSGAYNIVIKDKDGVEYMVTEQDLPLNIRNNKAYKAAKAAVYSARSAQPTTSGKTKIDY